MPAAKRRKSGKGQERKPYSVSSVKSLNNQEESKMSTDLQKAELGKASSEESSPERECPKCCQTFKEVESFRSHLKTHNSNDNSCGVCEKKLSSASSRDRHMLTHTGERPFKCQFCNAEFTTNGNMHRHMHIHKTKEAVVPEKIENKNTQKSPEASSEIQATVENVQVPSQTTVPITSQPEPTKFGFQDLNSIPFSSMKFPLVAAKAGEEDPRRVSHAKFQCSICQKHFPSDSSLKSHMMIHDIARSNKCPFCDCYCQSIDLLQVHRLLHHRDLQNTSDKSEFTKREEFMHSLGLHRNPVLPSVEEYKRRVKKNANVWLRKSDELYDLYRKGNKEEVEAQTGKEADSIENENENFNKNEESNNEQNSDFADISSILYNVSSSMGGKRSSLYPLKPAINLRLVPEDVQSGENLGSDSNCFNAGEKEDRQAIGFKGKSHTCPTCNYSSNDKSSLKRHIETHKKVHPFKCKYCNTSFTLRSNGERHVKQQHGLEGQNLLSAIINNPDEFIPGCNIIACKYCGENFANQKALNHHIRSQKKSCQDKPFLCLECNFGFSSKNNVVRHIKHQHAKLLTNGEKNKAIQKLFRKNPNIGEKKYQEATSTDSDVEQLVIDVENRDSGHGSLEDSLSPLRMTPEQPSSAISSDAEMEAAEALMSLTKKHQVGDQPLNLRVPSLVPASLSPPRDEASQNLQVLPVTPPSTEKRPYEECPLDLSLPKRPRLDECVSADNKRVAELECEICHTRLSSKSNKKRHLKKIHGSHGNQQLKPQPVKMTASTVSRNTKDALVNRVLQHTDTNRDLKHKDSSPLQKDPISPDSSDSENQDLASVPAVLNTVNSNKFSQYLGTECSDSVVEKQTPKSDNRLKCVTCVRSFPWKSVLNRHLVTHTKEKNFQCKECKGLFSTSSNLKRHEMNLHKNGVVSSPKPAGGSILNLTNLKRHEMNLHRNGSVSSPKPAGGSILNLTTTQHLDVDFEDKTTCMIVGSTKGLVTAHSSSYVPMPFNSDEARLINPFVSEPKRARSLQCTFCNATFASDSDLGNHVTELHPVECGREVSPVDVVNRWKRRSGVSNSKSKIIDVQIQIS